MIVYSETLICNNNATISFLSVPLYVWFREGWEEKETTWSIGAHDGLILSLSILLLLYFFQCQGEQISRNGKKWKDEKKDTAFTFRRYECVQSGCGRWREVVGKDRAVIYLLQAFLKVLKNLRMGLSVIIVIYIELHQLEFWSLSNWPTDLYLCFVWARCCLSK